MVLLALLFGVLSNADNAVALGLWCVLVALSMLHWWWYATRQLAKPPAQVLSTQKMWQLVALHAVDGALWGLLPWVAIDGASVTGLVLIMSVMTAVAANSMSLLSPVLAVYGGFIVAEMLVACSKMALMSDPSYWVFGFAGVLFLLIMIGQGYNNARSARATINLRFENSQLVEKLRLESELAQAARSGAERANSAKSTFLAAASHDLRQPIHAQGLFLDILSRSGLTASQNEVLTSAISASRATSDMLNTLLDFSRIEAGVVEPNLRAFAVQKLLQKVENDLAPLADAKDLLYRSRDCDQRVQSDPVLVEMIVRNLVSNAIRYSDAGGVLVACRKRQNMLVLEVWDTGIGIAPENQEEVFREFHQLGNPERDRRKGLGLGLAIAQGLAKTLGHSLTLSSKPGRGSVFKLALPLAQPVTLDIPTALAASDSDFSVGTFASSAYDMVDAPTQADRVLALAGLRVLVVDDDETVRSAMSQLLGLWGCVCSSVAGIGDALLVADSGAIDVVISDYRLREKRTGTHAISAVRERLGKTIPALLVTGDTAPERLRQASSSGIHLLHKPVQADALFAALCSLTGRRLGT